MTTADNGNDMREAQIERLQDQLRDHELLVETIRELVTGLDDMNPDATVPVRALRDTLHRALDGFGGAPR